MISFEKRITMSNTQPTAQTANPPVKIQVWIDFVCPYCLLGETVIKEATDELNVEIEWMPLELRPFPTPTLRPEDEYLPSAWKRGVYPTAQRMSVDIKLPTVSPQPYTRTAFLGLQYATAHGKADDYVDAVLRAFFQQDLDIGDVKVLKRILVDLGLQAEGLDEVVASPEANARHDEALRTAQALGVRAVPSVAIGDRLFSGVPDTANLRATIMAA